MRFWEKYCCPITCSTTARSATPSTEGTGLLVGGGGWGGCAACCGRLLTRLAGLRRCCHGSCPPALSAAATEYGPAAVEGAVVAAWLLASTAVLHAAEGWTWLDSVYCCVTAITTVGFGDVAPVTPAGRLVMIVAVLLSLVVVTACFMRLARRMSHLQYKRRRSALSESDLIASYRRDTLHAFSLLLVVVGAGASFVRAVERFSWEDSIYWAIVAASAVGFGDISLSAPSRAFCIFYLPIAVVSCAGCAASLVALLLQHDTARRLEGAVSRGVTAELIASLDTNADGAVDKCEFVTHVLLQQEKIAPEDISYALGLYASLDKDGSGLIDSADIISKPDPLSKPDSKPAKGSDMEVAQNV